MLAKIENAYLAILRVVVLVVATVALLAAVFSLLTSLPAVAGMIGLREPAKPRGGTLTDYIAAKRDTAPEDAAEAEDSSKTVRETIPADVREAATQFQTYTKGQDGAADVKLTDWEDGIIGLADDMPFEMQANFYADNKSLAEQLNSSKGKKLTVPQVQELIVWNAAEFVSDARLKLFEYEQEQAEAGARLAWAGGAFLVFLLVIFTFLFVKVERSLRLVRTVREQEIEHAD